jgi:hypothetical protein
VFSGVSSLSTRDAEGPGDCGLVFIAKEADEVGDKIKSRNHCMNISNVKTSRLGTIFLTPQSIRISEVSDSKFKEFYCIMPLLKRQQLNLSAFQFAETGNHNC